MPTSKKNSVKPPVGSSASIAAPAIPQDATLLTVRETAATLRVSVSAVRAWVLHRTIPFLKIHKTIRFHRADIDALIAESRVPAVPAKADVREREERAA
jgi:excisionase family DNA binding protein